MVRDFKWQAIAYFNKNTVYFRIYCYFLMQFIQYIPLFNYSLKYNGN